MKDLNGKVAFITGGASGIGLGMATAFLKIGMKVVVADIRADRLPTAASALRQISDDVVCVEVDTTSKESIEAAANQAETAFGNVHVLCNNAGIGGGGTVLSVPDERWQRVMDVNLWGPLRGVQVFLPRMLKHGEGGHIVNTASFSGIHGHHNQSSYGTSKFALVGFSEFLRNDMAKENVSVSVLCPHVIDTPIFYPDLADDDIEGIKKRREAMAGIYKIAVQPETVGEQVIRAIQTDELYIFCDGKESREMLEERTQAMFAAFDRQFPESSVTEK